MTTSQRKKTKSYLWHETHDIPEEVNGMKLKGWIWRRRSSYMKWTFTSSIHNASRSYPSTAEFVPVYVEGET